MPEEQQPSWRPARRAVAAIFFVSGALLATWAPYLPVIQRRLALSDGDLGWALFAMTVGALLSVVMIGRWIARHGSRRVTAFTAPLLCLSIAGPIFAPSFLTLALTLFLFGVIHGSLDVAMNAQAAEIQSAARFPLMSGLHGLYSLGGLSGSALAAVLLAADLDPLLHVSAVIVCLGLLSVAVSPRMLPPAPRDKESQPAMRLPVGPLLGLSLLAFVMFVGEGAVVDWATVFMANELSASPGAAVLGFTAFSGAMAAARFLGDRVIAAIGASRFAVISAAVAAVGLGIAVSAPVLSLSVAGFAVGGLGFANLIPILFARAASSTPDEPQKGIAGVAGIGYFGLVAGPPAIGMMAEAVGLRGALGFVAAAMGVAALTLPAAFRAASQDQSSEQSAREPA